MSTAISGTVVPMTSPEGSEDVEEGMGAGMGSQTQQAHAPHRTQDCHVLAPAAARLPYTAVVMVDRAKKQLQQVTRDSETEAVKGRERGSS